MMNIRFWQGAALAALAARRHLASETAKFKQQTISLE